MTALSAAFATIAVLLLSAAAPTCPAQQVPAELFVDPVKGRDRGEGTARAPLRSLAAALARLPDPLDRDVTIRLAAGRYATVGDDGLTKGTLQLDVRMKGAARVLIAGPVAPAEGDTAVLDWQSSVRPFLIEVAAGRWSLENLRLGTRQRLQRQGISVRGPSVLRLSDVNIDVGSLSGAGLRAHGGGEVHLAGRVTLNADCHDALPEGESFAGIVAEDHGIVRFVRRDGASLSIGNGSLASSYYGVIRLGCESARITSWGGQSNCIAVNNSGRVDLHGTPTTLRPRKVSNSPIGLEHDGHVLAEGAHVVIEVPEGGSGIVLQKASTFYCQDVEFRGRPKYALLAYSGSNFAGGFRGDLGAVHATTGASIVIGTCTGALTGPFQATRLGSLMLPDGRELPERR